MRSFASDTSNDLVLVVREGLEAVLLVAAHAAQGLLGEMVLAKDQGMPYFQTVWVGNASSAAFEAAFRERVTQIDGVLEIASLEIEQQGDVMRYTAEIVTTFGVGHSVANYRFLNETGVVLPDTAETRTVVENEFREAFGNDLDVSPETPQGVLIVGETLARDTVIRNNADLANQINPNLAGGIFLDAIWRLTGGERVAATPSLVRGVRLTGVPGAVVPAGSLASVGPDGPVFELLSSVVLSSGMGTGVFQAVDLGPIAAPIGALNTIVTGALGWETITNLQPASLGRAQESDSASRTRRRQTLALQGITLPEAIMSGLYTVEGVRSAVFRENVTNQVVTAEGITLAPHSVFVCVDGGADADVGMVLLRKKSIGAGWNGSTGVSVKDPYSGQIYPVFFSRPTAVPIFVRVTVQASSAFTDVASLVRQSMLDYASGRQEGERGFVVGASVSAFELAGAVNRDNPTIHVRSVQISSNNLNFSAAEIPIGLEQIATLLDGNIQVTVAP